MVCSEIHGIVAGNLTALVEEDNIVAAAATAHSLHIHCYCIVRQSVVQYKEAGAWNPGSSPEIWEEEVLLMRQLQD